MSIPEASDAEVSAAALASAMSEVLASVVCENAVLRILLVERGLFSEKDWERTLKDFNAQKWKTRKNEIQDKILEVAKHTRQRMMRGSGGKPH